MSDETPRSSSAFRVMFVAVLLAWAACGVYRWQVPPLAEARTTVQVPAATDLGTLCQRPEVKEASREQFMEAVPDCDPERVILGGSIFARKIQRTNEKTSPEGNSGRDGRQESTDTWEISYRSNRSANIVGELSALLFTLEQRVQAADESAHDKHAPYALSSKMESLEEQLLNSELTLELLNEQQPEGSGTDGIANQEQRLLALSREHAAVEQESQQLRLEGQLVEDEYSATQELTTAVRVTTSKPIQDAVRQLEAKVRLSTELTRLNESEQRLADIYGERHPKLVDVRNRFEQVLAELGGWDEVIDGTHLGEKLHSAIEEVVAEQTRLERQLAEDLESQREHLTKLQTSARQIAERSNEHASLTKELSALQASTARNAKGKSLFKILREPEQVELPWYLQSSMLYVLATICGLAAGNWIHRSRSTRLQLAEETSELTLPTFSPMPEANLDLAQRRAVRQARLKQAYA